MRSNSEVQAILKKAKEYGRQHGLRLTEGRLLILEKVLVSRRPVKAYDLIADLSEGHKPMPPLVYRALDFWTAHGFIHRIESLNAYTACTHPGRGHECHIFVCSQCGRVSEICDEKLTGKINHKADSLGFRIDHLSIEATGRCPDCR